MSVLLVILLVWIAGWFVALRPVGKKHLNARKEVFVERDCPRYVRENQCRAAHGMKHIKIVTRERNAAAMWAIAGKSTFWPVLALGEGMKAIIPLSESEKEAQRRAAEESAKALEEQTAKELEALEQESQELTRMLYEANNGGEGAIEREIETRVNEAVTRIEADARKELLGVKETLWSDHLKKRDPSVNPEEMDFNFPKASSKSSGKKSYRP